MQGDAQVRGERRWTAVLCADLVDFTGISQKLGPEKTYELMREVVGAARQEIEAKGGHIIEYAGDALFAVFGAPTAVENASLEACRAALAVQERMDKEAAHYRKSFDVSPMFRIGLAGGSVVFGSLGHGERLDINVLGDAVNLAMRLQKETPNGTVICSDAIHNQVEGFADFESNGPTKIKGLSEVPITHRVRALKEEVSYFQGRMQRGARQYCGRLKELATLETWLNEPTIPMIEVSGPAGVGKSRLIHEFFNQIDAAPEIFVGQCNANIQQTPLSPIIEMFRKAIRWTKGLPKAQIEAGFGELVDATGPAFDFIVNRIDGTDRDRSQQSVSPNIGIEVRGLCIKALKSIANRGNVLFLIEDTHWIDASSEAIINGFVEASDSPPACRFITTARSLYPRKWTGHKNVQDLPLDPLSPSSVKDLVTVLLDVNSVGDELIALVDEKSERNPLFVEEIVRFLVFSGAIETTDTEATLKPGNAPNIVSGNLQHLVLSRFDALPAEDRQLLIIAATRGRQFSTSFLETCAPLGTDTQACLDRALDSGLIEDDPSRGDNSWRFSHALIGDAIYQSLLGPQRRDVHELIAVTLEKGIEGRQKASMDELATHFTAAGNTQKAVHYLWQSAEKAYDVFAVVLVDKQLDAAFELIDAQPDLVDDTTFGRMLFLWARTLDVNGNFFKLNAIIERHVPRLRQQGASDILSLCLSMQALSRCHAAEFKRAQGLLDEALLMAQNVGDEVATIWAKVVQMRIFVDSGFGGLSAVMALYNEVRPAAENLQDSHLTQTSTYTIMTAYRSQGSLKQANEFIDWLTDFGTKNKSTRAIAMSHWARCLNFLIRQQMDDAISEADANLALTVVDTADWRVAAVGKIIARLGRGDPEVTPELLLDFITTLKDSEDTTLGNAARGQYCIHLMNRGKLYKGWTGFTKLREDIRNKSTPENQRFFELVSAETHMSVGGIIPPRLKKRPKMGVLDILTALRLKIGAAKKAERHLNRFLEMAPVERGYFVARVMRNFGLLEKSRGNAAKADEYLAKSIALYEAEDMFETALEIEKMRST